LSTQPISATPNGYLTNSAQRGHDSTDAQCVAVGSASRRPDNGMADVRPSEALCAPCNSYRPLTAITVLTMSQHSDVYAQ
jgi:hypothetical protein